MVSSLMQQQKYDDSDLMWVQPQKSVDDCYYVTFKQLSSEYCNTKDVNQFHFTQKLWLTKNYSRNRSNKKC
jgi:hypothetical protein